MKKSTLIIAAGLGYLAIRSKGTMTTTATAPNPTNSAVAPPGNAFMNLTPGFLTNMVRGVLGGARSTSSPAPAPAPLGPGSGPGFNDFLGLASGLASAAWGTFGQSSFDPAVNQTADAAIQDWQNQVANYQTLQNTPIDPALTAPLPALYGNTNGDPIDALPTFTPAIPILDPTSEGWDPITTSSPADPFAFDPTAFSAGSDFTSGIGDFSGASDFTDFSSWG